MVIGMHVAVCSYFIVDRAVASGLHEKTFSM